MQPQHDRALQSVLSEHAEGAAFRRLLRDATVCAPHRLRIAGANGWELWREEFEWQDPGEMRSGRQRRPGTPLFEVRLRPAEALGL
jgi:hypothetical protein